MSGRQFIRVAMLAGFSLGLASCGSGEAELLAYAQARKMSEKQTAAFVACSKGMKANKAIFPSPGGNMLMKSTPMDICDCQTNTIVRVFAAEKDYKNYATFAEYMAKAKKKKPPRFSKLVLNPNVKPGEAGVQLEKSLLSCVTKYKSANADLDPPLLELVPQPETVKKDEAATGSAS